MRVRCPENEVAAAHPALALVSVAERSRIAELRPEANSSPTNDGLVMDRATTKDLVMEPDGRRKLAETAAALPGRRMDRAIAFNTESGSILHDQRRWHWPAKTRGHRGRGSFVVTRREANRLRREGRPLRSRSSRRSSHSYHGRRRLCSGLVADGRKIVFERFLFNRTRMAAQSSSSTPTDLGNASWLTSATTTRLVSGRQEDRLLGLGERVRTGRLCHEPGWLKDA